MMNKNCYFEVFDRAEREDHFKKYFLDILSNIGHVIGAHYNFFSNSCHRLIDTTKIDISTDTGIAILLNKILQGKSPLRSTCTIARVDGKKLIYLYTQRNSGVRLHVIFMYYISAPFLF